MQKSKKLHQRSEYLILSPMIIQCGIKLGLKYKKKKKKEKKERKMVTITLYTRQEKRH